MKRRKIALVMNKCLSRAVHVLTVCCLIAAILAGGVQATAATAAPENSAFAAIVTASDGQTVLYEKNADAPQLIASTTKIMTALVVLEHADLNESVRIPDDFPPVDGSAIGLVPGETLTVRALLFGLLLDSGNDAAIALAQHVSGDVQKFVNLMNTKAAALGCRNAHFANPHGLDDDGASCSARDLAVITAAAMKNNMFREIVSTKTVTIDGRTFVSHNRLLWTCPGVTGVKTGYTEKAGRTLVSSAQRGGLGLICVTLGDSNDWADHSALYDWAFGEYRALDIRAVRDRLQDVSVISGVSENVPIRPDGVDDIVCRKDDKAEYFWSAPKFVYAPVTAGQTAGTLTVKINGKAVKTIPLVYDASVALDKTVPLSVWEKIKRALSLPTPLPSVRESYAVP
ncbi:D-alanyl-D-alanine carboxypeptidase [Oscillospiraceae bacterium CM]|nr:D-alanyl-D-alanine carboxypeptidase [Oscillospiraceae bacterium CM]